MGGEPRAEGAEEEGAERALKEDAEEKAEGGKDGFLRQEGHGAEDGIPRMREEKDERELRGERKGVFFRAGPAAEAADDAEGEHGERRLYGGAEACLPGRGRERMR